MKTAEYRYHKIYTEDYEVFQVEGSDLYFADCVSAMEYIDSIMEDNGCYKIRIQNRCGNHGRVWYVEDRKGTVYLKTQDEQQARECYERMLKEPVKKFPGVPADFWG